MSAGEPWHRRCLLPDVSTRCRQANAMSAHLAHLRGGPRHGQTIQIEQPALCLLLPEHDGEAVYDLCATADFAELIYRYSHTDHGEPSEDSGLSTA